MFPLEVKLKCFVNRMIQQSWGCVVLTDMKGDNGVREFSIYGRSWTLVTRGKIGFLLEDAWAEWWREGNGVTYASGPRTGIQFPRRGWRRGLYLVGVYAPTSDATSPERQALRSQVSEILQMAQATSLTLVLGDFNAELGNSNDSHQVGRQVMGSFGDPRVTVAGLEWRAWAEGEDLSHCHSRFQQNQRHTWEHPRFLSQHELDHVFVATPCLWHVTSCRVLHEGPSVSFPWSDYTDHNPVEIRLRHGKLWQVKRSQVQQTPKPDVQKMRGDTPEAKHLRETWQQQVETAIQAFQDTHPGTSLTSQWDTITELCRNTAVQVCGTLLQAQGQPWLKGREQEIHLLDQIISQARHTDKQIRQNSQGLPPDQLGPRKRNARLALNQARHTKRQAFSRWEEEWMNQKAQDANEAAQLGRMGTLFQIIRELSQAKAHRKRFGLRRTENPQNEAEAWKEHFKQIQDGIGDIPEAVWNDVKHETDSAEWLAAPPTREEVQKAINDMSYGKAPGADLFMAEYLKMAGPLLKNEIIRITQAVWTAATQAEEGTEATQWPDKWKQGIIFPLWKRKGDRHDKNTWRGITLLSVGSKLVARVCSARLQRWSSKWLNPFQFGFRSGFGVDDVQQVTRSILEEAAGSLHDKIIWFRFYDLEKAYPKVSRPGLWRLLQIKGCPTPFLRVLQAVHDHTASSVRFEGVMSTSFVPDRGLREGCPSSPILFNIYHSGIMEVFRARRTRAAAQQGWIPG